MADHQAFSLDSKSIAALPIVNEFMARLKLSDLFSAHLPPPDARTRLEPVATLGAFLRCLIIARTPLYSVIEWARPFHPLLLGCRPEQLNDDRIGRSLDRLFDADRCALLTDFVLHLIKEFAISPQELHNDSTSITLTGWYGEADGRPMRGKQTLRVRFGHNKDHRPDLKQLLWILTVTEEGVPVHFKVADGNTEDSRTHWETWQALCLLVGHPRFLYVADCKLCTRATLRAIHGAKGRFVTILPQTRKEDSQFRRWLGTHSPQWLEVASYPGRLKDDPPDLIRTVDAPFPDPDGFRLMWFHSSAKEGRDGEERRERIARALEELEELKTKVESPRSRLKRREGIAEKADRILAHRGVQRWLRYTIEERREPNYRQEKRGRAGAQTRWRRSVSVRHRLSWEAIPEAIEEDARCDGVFPLLSNCPELSVKEILEAYKRKHPLIEKRHQMLKSVLGTTPVFLKNIGRVEAFLFMEFIAMTVHALVERELRRAMEREGITKLDLYPEERECSAPTAARVFDVLATLQRHILRAEDGEVVQRFMPEFSKAQKQVLNLLGIPVSRFQAGLD
jgi:transposase